MDQQEAGKLNFIQTTSRICLCNNNLQQIIDKILNIFNLNVVPSSQVIKEPPPPPPPEPVSNTWPDYGPFKSHIHLCEHI